MTTIDIYIPDVTYEDDQWEEKSAALKAELEAEFGCTFEEAHIGAGASFPAFLTELSLDAWPYLAMALYAFFKGKDIQPNLDAWKELYKKLNQFRKRRPYFNREGSAVIVVDEIITHLGHDPDSFNLIGYVVSPLGAPHDLDAIAGIEEGPDQLHTGWTVQLFEVEAEGRTFKILVDGNDVYAIEIVEET